MIIPHWGRASWHHILAAVIVAGAMSVTLGLQIERRASILRDGVEVLLQTTPVDPRDLLRGDYVILNYGISSVPASLVIGPAPRIQQWHRLWVRLKQQADGFWVASEASFVPLTAAEDSVVIRSLPVFVYDNAATQTYHVDYGIERFYVPEGEGRAVENARDQMAVAVAVRIDAAGEAQIRALMVNGVQVYNEPLY